VKFEKARGSFPTYFGLAQQHRSICALNVDKHKFRLFLCSHSKRVFWVGFEPNSLFDCKGQSYGLDSLGFEF
jgi:hypothetical protein